MATTTPPLAPPPPTPTPGVAGRAGSRRLPGLARLPGLPERPGGLGPRPDRAADVVLGTTAVASGLLAGVFYGYASSVVPGLARGDDRTLVAGMQQINEAIINPVFFLTFLGAPALNAVSYALERRTGRDDRVRRRVLAGLGLSVLSLTVTMTHNVPLNDALARAGHPDRIADLPRVRAAFLRPWAAGNVVRTVATTGAFACLVGALAARRRPHPRLGARSVG